MGKKLANATAGIFRLGYFIHGRNDFMGLTPKHFKQDRHLVVVGNAMPGLFRVVPCLSPAKSIPGGELIA
jgi:hypothetical protein